MVLLDGDRIRELFGNLSDYSEPNRVKQVERLRSLAIFLSEQNVSVIVTVLYSSPDLMDWNRLNIKDYYEVYLDTPLETVMQRDAKGIYSKAVNGQMPNVVGLDIPWFPPEKPDLWIDGGNGESAEKYAEQILLKCSILDQDLTR